MRHTAPNARRLLSIFLTALILFPNLLFAPQASAASPQQTQIRLYGYVKNQFGQPIPGALVTISGQAAGGIATDSNGYYQFSLFNGSCGPFEFKAFVNVTNGAQMGEAVSATDCYFSDHALPDIIYNQPLTNGKIVFNKWGAVNATPEDGVYLINADGTGETKIPGSQGDYAPVWSPDGLRIAVTRPPTSTAAT